MVTVLGCRLEGLGFNFFLVMEIGQGIVHICVPLQPSVQIANDTCWGGKPAVDWDPVPGG